MSSRFKIPKEIVVPVILLNGKSAKIISRSDAQAMCDLSDGRKPSARRCGSQKARSDLWPGTRELEVYRLTDFGYSELPPRRGLSSRMSPRHPRANGGFRRGAYHDLLDGADPVASLSWGDQNRHHNGPALCYYFETCKGISDRDENGMRLCRACAEKAEIEPELLRIPRTR